MHLLLRLVHEVVSFLDVILQRLVFAFVADDVTAADGKPERPVAFVVELAYGFQDVFLEGLCALLVLDIAYYKELVSAEPYRDPFIPQVRLDRTCGKSYRRVSVR